MPRPPKQPPVDGLLVINKPSGRTSHDVVEFVRQLAGFRGIGHLGTLDPIATGVLVLALGKSYAPRALLQRALQALHLRDALWIRDGYV